MPAATYTHVALAEQPIDVVWDRLQSAETWSTIGPVDAVWDAVHENELLRSYRWRTTIGPTSYAGTARVVASERPRRMQLLLDAREVAGTLTTELHARSEAATEIAVTLEVVSRGMLSTLFFPVVSEAVGNGLPEQVDTFAATFSH